jgi:RNA polymerase sigma factor (sigma-70 family)
MEAPDPTRWTIILGAREGDPDDRLAFATVYEPIVRTYFRARWRNSPMASTIDDAVQDVFLDLFRDGGPLSRVERGRPGGFRAYLYGVLRVTALRNERDAARRWARGRQVEDEAIGALPIDEPGVSTSFDRAWAEAMVREAGSRQRARAREKGAEAQRRVEILRLRFEEGWPIRDIARHWGEDAGRVHHEYAKARREFHDALLEVVAAHHPGASAEAVEREAQNLLEILS